MKYLIGGWLIWLAILLLLWVASADAHENDCWYHLPECGTGLIYGSEKCELDVQKVYRDKDRNTWQYLMWSDGHFHVFSPNGRCEVRAKDLGCWSDQDDAHNKE